MTNLLSLGLRHVRLQHGPEHWRPRAEQDLVAVEHFALALHLHVREVLAIEDVLQVHTQLFVLALLRLQAPGVLLWIFRA